MVQVFLSDSRKYNPKQASEIAYEAAKKLEGLGSINLYQKIDSTMRGNPGIEIEAILDALKRKVAVLCPSFPGMGRTIIDGKLMVNNVPISQTLYSNDPRNPIHNDKLADMVRLTNKTIEVKETDCHNLEKTLEEQLSGTKGKSIVIVDAAADDDLRNIAEILLRFPEVLPVGSAGLGAQLSRAWNITSQESNNKISKPSIEQIIIASGSANPRSHKQLSLLESAENVSVIRVNVKELVDDESAQKEMDRVKKLIKEQIKYNKVITVALAGERVKTLRSDKRGFESFIGKLVAYFMKESDKKPENIGIVIAGADTSVAICNSLDIHTVWPQLEVVTGIPYNLGDNRYNIISKAGGFGEDDALIKSLHFFLDK